MQKLAKRAAQAQRQAARRAKQRLEQQNVEQRFRGRQMLRTAVAEMRQNLEEARRARREDWELGPLSPKRDLGFNKYGLLKQTLRQDWAANGMPRPRPEIVERRCAWAGGSKMLNLAPQDRVVILDGPDRGKIDRIKSVNAEAGYVTLENHHRALAAGLFSGPGRSQPMPIVISAIRLVHPITNPDTGITQDVVINELKAVPPNMKSENMTWDRWQYGNKWDRVVPGINVVIPWPEVKPPELETTTADTVREQVEERSFYYNLLSSPLPETVIDELRNKFSRFRTRHEPWYIEREEAKMAERQHRWDSVRSMATPLDELQEKQRQLRAAQAEPELTDGMLEKLGRIMAQANATTSAEGSLAKASASRDDGPLPKA